MSIWKWFRARRDSQLVNRQIDRIVARCLTSLREAVSGRVSGMPRAEARGYVRVQAAAMVAKLLRQSGDAELPAERHHSAVTVQAADRLAIAVVEQLRRDNVRTITPVRRAA